MEIREQPKLLFFGVDIAEVKFKSLKKIEDEVKINVNIEPRGYIPKDDPTKFFILMHVKVNSVAHFNLTFTAIGNFKIIPSDLSFEERKSFIDVNAVAIMFPYVRSFISTFTSALGKSTGNIIIPTRFFKGELKLIENVEELSDLLLVAKSE